MSVNLIFSFDSEDYVTPEAADAELWWAKTMTRHGITACVCLVAELARRLHETGRNDVLDAWDRHEIAYHTDFHSKPPSPAQYLDPCGWEDGIAEVMRREGRGIGDVEALTGQHPIAFCKPGSSWGPQACPAMTRMDVPIFADGPLSGLDPSRPIWYAGQMMLNYHTHFDGYFDREEGRLDRMKRDFESRLAAHSGGYLIMYTHPCRLVTADFWDGVNFRRGANPPRDRWKPAPLRPPETIALMKRDFDAFLGWVVKHPDVNLATYRQLYSGLKESPARSVDRETVLTLLREVEETPGWVVHERIAYSPAEILGMAAALFARGNGRLTGGNVRPTGGNVRSADGNGRLPDSVPLRRLYGPSDDAPETADGRTTLDSRDLLAAAKAADAVMSETGRLPSSAPAGRTAIGPGTLLRTLARWARTPERVPERTALSPGPELPAFARTEQLAKMTFKNGWVVFPEDFAGENVARHARLQAWTAKPCIHT